MNKSLTAFRASVTLFFALMLSPFLDAQEVTPPVLSSLTLSNSSVNTTTGSQTVTLDLVFTDENGVSINTFSLENLTDSSQTLFTQQGPWESVNDKHRARFTAQLSASSTAGIWQISGFTPQDNLGNSSNVYDTPNEIVIAGFSPYVSHAKQANANEFDAIISAGGTFSQTGNAQTSLLNITLQDAQAYNIWFVPNNGTDISSVTFSGAISIAQNCSILADYTLCTVTSSNNNASILASVDTTADDITTFGYSALVQINASGLEADWLNNYVEFPVEDFDGDGIPNEQDLDDDNDGVNDTDDSFPLDATETVDFDSDGIGDNSDIDDDNDGVPDDQDDFPFDENENADNDGDGLGNNADTDDDNDGVIDSQDAFPFDASETLDTDADGIGNNADDDDDNDGGTDDNDAFPLDPTETIDSDGDGIGNNADTDDDNDGTLDVNDAFPRDPTETLDTDEDGIGNNTDDDDDNDGVRDVDDVFPLDPGEFRDNDLDGIGDSSDNDDDNDGVLDFEDEFPFNPNESIDTDNDGIGNNADFDDDNDGLDDIYDAFPLDPTEIADYDGDLIGDNADNDDDNDGVVDSQDAFPFAVTEWFDTDGDGIGNNADPDNDNDGVDDEFDAFENDASEIYDFDGDGIGDNADTDDDNDSVNDNVDAFPRDPSETLDTDLDGVGNNTDDDDDGDNVLDVDDLFPLDRNESQDNDLDGIGNNADNDDDNDSVIDSLDAFPFDPSETSDFDSDGVGDNADTDDDNDNFPDAEDIFPFDPLEWADFDLDGIGDNRDTDDDNDGVLDSQDAFPFDATETLDNDNDGIGNNADDDDDNDGVLDTVDAFPFSDAESIDTDSDGIGNNADTDDDNDGIVDADDSQPLNPSIGDNIAPVLDNLDNISIEATGILTPVTLIPPRLSDNNLNEATLVNDYDGPLPLGVHLVTWTATDFAGNQTQLVQTVTVLDTTAPEFPSVSTIEISARGLLTDVTQDIQIQASDIVDGSIDAEIVTESKLKSGQQSVIISATDNSGNTQMLEVFVDIKPLIVTKSEALIAPGASIELEIGLSGLAPSYPASVDYQIIGPVTNLTSGTVNIDRGQLANITIDAALTATLGEQIYVSFSNPINAEIGDVSQITINVDTTNFAPIATVTAQQNLTTTSVVYQDQGNATLSVAIDDINQDDRHSVSWSFNGASLRDLSLDNEERTFDFDPNTLAPGVYIARATVTETNTLERFSTIIDFPLIIETEQPTLLDTRDSDFDGVSDATEGLSDSDEDGIPDYLDNNEVTSSLPTGVSEQPLTTLSGYQLTIGDIARVAQGNTASSGAVTETDLQLYGGIDGGESLIYTDIHYEAQQSIVNFNIEGLAAPGESVPVIIPLSTGTSIPADATYRKYNARDGWYTFVENSENNIMSAPFDADGNCPAYDSALFMQGLNAGDTCIKLTIQDGGPNDSDLLVNGVIKDPGVLSIQLSNSLPTISVTEQLVVLEGELVRVDASLTSDAQNDNLLFSWTQIGGDPIALTENSTPLLSFTAPNVDGDVNLLFKLEVFDGRDTATKNVNVRVKDQNYAPQGSINSHSTVIDEARQQTLSVQATDNNNDILSYTWTQIDGPSVVINGQNTAQITFTAPQVDTNTNVSFRVVVSDGAREIALTTSITVVDTSSQNQNSGANNSSEASGDSGGGTSSIVALLFLLAVWSVRQTRSAQ